MPSNWASRYMICTYQPPTRLIAPNAQVDIGVPSDLSNHTLACMPAYCSRLCGGTQILRTYFLL